MIRRVVAALFIGALLAPGASAAPLPAKTPPVVCPSGQVFVETQAWWGDAPSGLDFTTGPFGKHVHVGLCFPLYGSLTGSPSFDFRIVFHGQPAGSRFVRFRGGTASFEFFNQTSGLPAVTNDAPFTISKTLNLSTLSGWQELRVSAMVDGPDGKRQFQSAGLQFYVGTGSQPLPTGYTVARGWYTGHEYQNPGIRPSSFPFTPRSGTWSPDLRRDKGAGGLTTAEEIVTVDPDFHAGSNGLIFSNANGPRQGAVPIDTTLLADGWHTLFIGARDQASDGSNAGGLVVWFVSQNGIASAAAPSPSPSPSPSPTC